MERQIYVDGTLYPKPDAKISVYDHGLLYGDGVFEGIRVYGGKIFEAAGHFERLYQSAKSIRLTIPLGSEDLLAAVERTVAANEFVDCYVRLIITRGAGTLGLNPTLCPTASVVIIADTIQLYPEAFYDTGISVITASVIRTHPNALSPRIKSLNYLNNILAKLEAVDAGVPEAVMLNGEGNVAECTADNLFIVRRGRVETPQTSDGILEGVTRDVILRLCRSEGIPAIEKTLQRHDLYVADECFITGTAAEVMPVTKIDGRVIGAGEPGPLTRRLHAAFHRHARGGVAGEIV